MIVRTHIITKKANINIQQTCLDSLLEGDLQVNNSNRDSGDEEEEEDESEVNHIGQKFENCRQTKFQTLIRQYGKYNYSLHLNECNRNGLIRSCKFQTIKLTRNDTKTVLLCYQYTVSHREE